MRRDKINLYYGLDIIGGGDGKTLAFFFLVFHFTNFFYFNCYIHTSKASSMYIFFSILHTHFYHATNHPPIIKKSQYNIYPQKASTTFRKKIYAVLYNPVKILPSKFVEINFSSRTAQTPSLPRTRLAEKESTHKHKHTIDMRLFTT